MGILDKYNKKVSFIYNNETERHYIDLKQLVLSNGEGAEYEVQALFINNKSRFGDAPIIVTENYFVNLPQHLLSTVKDMINDEEIVEMINNRKIKFSIYGYHSKNGDGFSVNWIE